jgi:hypothetical protein
VIVSGILSLVKAVLVGLLGALPHLAVPSWLTSIGSFVGTITSGLGGTAGWVPWGLLSLAVTLALAAVGLSVAIRGIRIAASFLTLGGGS